MSDALVTKRDLDLKKIRPRAHSSRVHRRHGVLLHDLEEPQRTPDKGAGLGHGERGDMIAVIVGALMTRLMGETRRHSSEGAKTP